MPRPTTMLMLSALLAFTVTESARAAQAPTCLSQAEMEGMFSYALPLAMDSVVKTCTPRLAPDGFFATQGTSLVQRYSARKAENWPVAKTALFKLAAQDKGKGADGIGLMRLLPDSALQPLAESLVAEELGKAIKPEACAPIERIVGLLAPLPPENTSALVTTIIALTDKPRPDGKGSDSGLHLCPVAKG